MRNFRKRILGFRSTFATSWWRAFLLGTLPFMAMVLADRLVNGYRVSDGNAYEAGKGHRTERERTERLIRVLPSLMGSSLQKMDVLCIGPRGGAELLLLWLYGIRWRRMTALDVAPRNRKVAQGDMHRIPYAGGSFDLLYAAFVVTYGRWEEAFREFRRVVKPGGLVALAWATDRRPIMADAEAVFGPPIWREATTYSYFIASP